MNLTDFNRNNLQQKTTLIWEKGNFLAVRYSSNCNVCLYSMGKFFVEIWYRMADNEINSIKAFYNYSFLEPYLEMVDLSEINH